MVEINNKTRSKINIVLVRRIVENFLKYYKLKKYEVSIAFVGDKTIKKLNKQYRKINKITDVLAFRVDDESNFLGEIIIDYAQIKRQAKASNKQELIYILVHGLLHLIGYNDKTEAEAEKMNILTNKIIKIL